MATFTPLRIACTHLIHAHKYKPVSPVIRTSRVICRTMTTAIDGKDNLLDLSVTPSLNAFGLLIGHVFAMPDIS